MHTDKTPTHKIKNDNLESFMKEPMKLGKKGWEVLGGKEQVINLNKSSIYVHIYEIFKQEKLNKTLKTSLKFPIVAILSPIII